MAIRGARHTLSDTTTTTRRASACFSSILAREGTPTNSELILNVSENAARRQISATCRRTLDHVKLSIPAITTTSGWGGAFHSSTEAVRATPTISSRFVAVIKCAVKASRPGIHASSRRSQDRVHARSAVTTSLEIGLTEECASHSSTAAVRAIPTTSRL